MKFRRRPLPLLLLLIPSLHYTTALRSDYQVADLAEGRPEPPPSVPTSLGVKSNADLGVGTEDAPVDGKDGRPHEGPFVETNAERGRKKAKENGDADVVKPPTKDGTKGASSATASDLPETNDGVMDDPNRAGPKEGTRGTEGGISEKNKDGKGQDGQTSGSKGEKKPDPPKEAPPLPHSEQEKLGSKDGKEPSKKKDGEAGIEVDEKPPKELGGLEKPADLPASPHELDMKTPESSKKKDPLAILAPYAPSLTLPSVNPSSLIQPLHSWLLSLIMIIFSEIGDKTFLIAALMAMKHPRLVVFTGALSALFAMTILSAVLGHAVPTLIPKRWTNLAAACLFLVFGLKMLKEGYAISPETGVSEEMKEVEMELEEKEAEARRLGRRRSSLTPYAIESGRIGSRKTRPNTRLPAPPDSPPSSSDERSPSPSRGAGVMSVMAGINNLFSLLLSPAWVQTFIMTFLGEWGDRSQIATIAMAAGQDYWWVTGGAVTGHAICTGIAVIGGRAIAGRVSLRVVTLGGAFAFLAFGIIYLVEAFYFV